MIDNENIGLSTSSTSTSSVAINTSSTNVSGSGICNTASSSEGNSRKNSISGGGGGSSTPPTPSNIHQHHLQNQHHRTNSNNGSNNGNNGNGSGSKPSSRHSSVAYNKLNYGTINNSTINNANTNNSIIGKIVEKEILKKQKKKNRTNSQKFWRTVGSILQIIGLASIVFTVFVFLRLDGYIDWNYWLLFIPVYFILMACFLATGSRILSTLCSWIIRLVWRTSVVGITTFTIFTILRLKYDYLLSYTIMMIPLIFTFSSTLLMGVYSLVYAILFIDSSITPQRKTKYIVNGLPLLFIGVVTTPAVIMVALRLDGHSIKLAVCFVSLFIGDIISSCFSFFLLLFSMGSKDTATFSIGQLFSILLITICSIVFKILLILKLDQDHSISYVFLMIPLLVAQIFIVFCGFNLFIRPPKTNYLDSTDQKEEEEETSNLINNYADIEQDIKQQISNNINISEYDSDDDKSDHDSNNDEGDYHENESLSFK